MCGVMEKYFEEEREKEREKERIIAIQNLLKKKFNHDVILDLNYTGKLAN